jgi:serine/threonine protein kinase
MTTTTEHTGTERYLAPELVTSNLPRPTTHSDVYALGCLCLEVRHYSLLKGTNFILFIQLIYLERPYAHRQSNLQGCIIIDIREGITPATRQEDVHKPLDIWWKNTSSWELMEAFWCTDPMGRPTASYATRLISPEHIDLDDTHIVSNVSIQRYDTRADEIDGSAFYTERLF